MSIAAFTGIIDGSYIYSGTYTGGTPTGGILVTGTYHSNDVGFCFDSGNGVSRATMDDILTLDTNIPVTGTAWSGYNPNKHILTFDKVTGFLRDIFDVLTWTDDSPAWLTLHVDTGNHVLTGGVGYPNVGALIFNAFYPDSDTVDTQSTDLVGIKPKALAFLTTGEYAPRKLSGSADADYIPYHHAGAWRVVFFEDYSANSWYAYDFHTQSDADTFLAGIGDPIISTYVVPGPHIVVIVGDGTGAIVGVVVTDDEGVVNDDGTRTIIGDIYTGVDIPADWHDFAVPVTSASTLTQAQIDVLPKMWRTRSTVDFPGDVQGHEPLYLCKGVSMLELKGKRMMDIYRKMPTTNPNTRD